MRLMIIKSLLVSKRLDNLSAKNPKAAKLDANGSRHSVIKFYCCKFSFASGRNPGREREPPGSRSRGLLVAKRWGIVIVVEQLL